MKGLALSTFAGVALRFIKLLEKEGRLARRYAARFAVAACIFAGAVACAFFALILFLGALFLAIHDQLGNDWALVVIGVLLLVAAAISAGLGKLVLNQRSPD